MTDMRRIAKLTSTAIVAALLILAEPCAAEPLALNDTAFRYPALSDQEIDAALTQSAQLLQAQKKNADYWEYGWGAFDAGTMIYSAVQAAQADGRGERNAAIVNSVESLIGLGDVVFRPLPAFNANSVCENADGTRKTGESCLAAQEALLKESAERAHEPYEWLPHLGNAGFNLAAGLVVWKVGGAGRALTTAIPGEIIGEIQLWTTPLQPIADLNGYQLRVSPALIQTGRAPATGLMLSMKF